MCYMTYFACDDLLYLAGKTKGFSHCPVKLSSRNSQEISARRKKKPKKTPWFSNPKARQNLCSKRNFFFAKSILARQSGNLEAPLASLRWFPSRPPSSSFVYLVTDDVLIWDILILFAFWTVSGRSRHCAYSSSQGNSTTGSRAGPYP